METLFVTQSIYRTLLDVMSRPGSVGTFVESAVVFDDDELLAVAATLLDQEVKHTVFGDELLADKIGEVTGSKPVPVERADYIFVAGRHGEGRIGEAQRGSLSYPDQGATVIYRVEHLREVAETPKLVLRGPGIDGERRPTIEGISIAELRLLSDINEGYPLGVDALFVDSSRRVMALPRSTQIDFC